MPKNQTFTNQTISLDGKEFDGCQFIKCEFVYSGGVPPRLTNCGFDREPDLSFTGPAAATMAFLTAMYHDGAFHGVIEATIDNIRKDKHPGGPVQ